MNRQDCPTLLIVDDEADLLELLAAEFRKKGYSVLTASGGNEAFALLEASKVDLVITDVNMPNGNGVDLLKRIKDQRSAIPVLIFVSDSYAITAEEAYAAGASKVLTKPFTRKALWDAVLAHLAAETALERRN